MVGIFNIGVSAIQNAQVGFMTTEHNIANVNTPGYSRQRAVQYSNIAVNTGSGYIGQGAHVQTIGRLFDQFIEKQLNAAQANVSYLDAYANQTSQVNNMLADTSAGMSPAIQDYFKAMQQAAADPASVATRQSVVSAAQVLSSRLQALEHRLSEQYRAVNGQIEVSVKNVNAYAAEIAELNGKIVMAEAKAAGQPPNDLYDLRDRLVADLNKLVNVQISVNSNNTYNVYIGSGQNLVTDQTANRFAAVPSSQDPSRFSLALQSARGSQELPDFLISGGTIGGMLNFRTEILDRAANDLGRIAASMALTMNAQHALGQDLNGNILGDANFSANLFEISAPRVIGSGFNAQTDPLISAAFDNPPPYNDNFFTNITNSDYRLESRGAGQYILFRQSDNKSWPDQTATPGATNTIAGINTALQIPIPNDPNGNTMSSEGFTLTNVTGTDAAANSSYLIKPTSEIARNFKLNPSVAADVRQLALAAPIRTVTGALNTGNAVMSAGSVITAYTSPTAGAPLVFSFDGTTSTLSLPTIPPAPDVVGIVNGQRTLYPSGTPVPYTNGMTLEVNGIRFDMSGMPRNGDTFQIQKNVNGISDSRNAARLASLQTQSAMSGQKASYQGVYAQLVADAGSKGHEVSVKLDAQLALLQDSQDQRQSLSGVNLDEEAANLMRYQQALQAASKMVSIANKLFDSILAI